jgi:hypothetical protein
MITYDHAFPSSASPCPPARYGAQPSHKLSRSQLNRQRRWTHDQRRPIPGIRDILMLTMTNILPTTITGQAGGESSLPASPSSDASAAGLSMSSTMHSQVASVMANASACIGSAGSGMNSSASAATSAATGAALQATIGAGGYCGGDGCWGCCSARCCRVVVSKAGRADHSLSRGGMARRGSCRLRSSLA